MTLKQEQQTSNSEENMCEYGFLIDRYRGWFTSNTGHNSTCLQNEPAGGTWGASGYILWSGKAALNIQKLYISESKLTCKTANCNDCKQSSSQLDVYKNLSYADNGNKINTKTKIKFLPLPATIAGWSIR